MEPRNANGRVAIAGGFPRIAQIDAGEGSEAEIPEALELRWLAHHLAKPDAGPPTEESLGTACDRKKVDAGVFYLRTVVHRRDEADSVASAAKAGTQGQQRKNVTVRAHNRDADAHPSLAATSRAKNSFPAPFRRSSS